MAVKESLNLRITQQNPQNLKSMEDKLGKKTQKNRKQNKTKKPHNRISKDFGITPKGVLNENTKKRKRERSRSI